jgi:hypothetical protein
MRYMLQCPSSEIDHEGFCWRGELVAKVAPATLLE